MISIYTVTTEKADRIQDSIEICWPRSYPSLGKAKVACLEELVSIRAAAEETITVLPPILKIEDEPIWILDDIGMTGKVFTIFETELQE